MTASSKDSFHLYFLPGWRLFDILRYYFKCRAALHRIQNRFKGRVVFPCKACLLQDLPVRSHLIIVWAIGMIFLILQLYHKNKMIDIDRLIKIYNIILQYVPNKYLQYKKFLK